MRRFALFLVIAVLGLFTFCSCEIKITILHTSDIRSHFEEMETRSGEKYGGIARRKTKIEELRNRTDLNNVILLDAGDQFSGTLWFYHYKSQAASHFMTELKYDAMSLGNHEFDDLHSLGEFLDNVNFPILCSNINASQVPRLQDKIKPSVVINKGGVRIGIIGYVTTRVVQLVDPDNFKNIEVKDILESVRAEVAKLQQDGVNVIITNGHAGILMDIEVAKLEGIDVVVGGDSETFMYTGDEPSSEEAQYPYPYEITKPSGGKALIVTAYEYGKYLGFLQATFDDDGNVISGSGNPVYLNESVAQDPEILTQVAAWKTALDDLKSEIVGQAGVKLEGEESVCRGYECNLGNLITDAIVHYYTVKLGATNNSWTKASIAIWNSGGIRATIPKGNISLGNVLEVLPFRNTLERVEITGATLKKVLEHSATNWKPQDPWGGFLQYAGLKVVYDRNKPEGSRVLEAHVQCSACEVPEYRPLDAAARYAVLAPTFLIKGGDGYNMLNTEQLSRTPYGQVDSDIFVDYLKERSPVRPGLEGRIQFYLKTDTSESKTVHSASSILESSVFFLLLCAFIQHFVLT